MAIEGMSMDGKVVMVTGATSGIGKAAARALADMGATLVGVGRNREKNERGAREMKEATGNTNVEFLLADLSVQAQIRRLAAEFKEKYNRLDVLVNNAGALFVQRQESADGIEMTFALNHLAYFMLTNLLIDVLKASAPSRIINVASGAHRGEDIDFDDLEMKRGYSGYRAYGKSKLANILFTYELARRLQGTGVTANAMHPGMVATNFGSNNPGYGQQRGKSPEEGADTVVYLAASPDVEGVTGKYFVDRQQARSSDVSYDAEKARRLWEISAEMTGLESAI